MGTIMHVIKIVRPVAAMDSLILLQGRTNSPILKSKIFKMFLNINPDFSAYKLLQTRLHSPPLVPTARHLYEAIGRWPPSRKLASPL